MGWRIHRVWSTEWFYEREHALEGIIRSIEHAETTPTEQPLPVPPTDPRQADTGPEPRLAATSQPQPVERRFQPGVPYRFYQPLQRLVRDHLLLPAHSNTLARTIADLVAVEGPIHYDLLLERLKELHYVERAGTNVQANIKRAIRLALRWQSIAHEPRSQFYRCPSKTLDRFRVPTEDVRRAIELVPREELALAVLYLVEDQFGLAEEATPPAVARLFGIERLWSEGAELVRGVIEELVAAGRLRRSGTQLYLG
jgi:hypothetical protein